MADKYPDGRDAAERRCTPLACAFEHCVHQHKYQVAPACQEKIELYEQCVKAERDRLGIAPPAAKAQAR